MTDRGLPIVDGAPACPFVAFEDDRDGRALAPDHRHRCFAEPRPAPRALAHQEAYCLSSAFPVCPTFQDWARREAAAARPAATPGRAPADEPPVSRPMPPLEREPRRVTDTPPPVPPRRSTQRDWAAPPPWTGDGPPPGPFGEHPGHAPTPPPEARGLAGSAAHRLAGPDPADPLSPGPTRSPLDDDLDTDYGKPREQDHGRYARPGSPAAVEAAAAGAAAGLAGSAAYAAAGRVPDDDPGADEPDWARDDPYGQPRGGRTQDARGYSAAPQRQPARAEYRDDRRQAPGPNDHVRRREPQDPSELFGPAWERPQRYEAYPSLRTRVGLGGVGGIGRIGGAALGLALAAVALFFIGPALLGIGGDDGDTPGAGGAGATPTPLVAPTPTPLPTEPPAPTPQVYVVAKGDTMSKIAARFDVTIEQLLAANPGIKDPNRIGIGDEITIPVPVGGSGDDEVDGGDESTVP